MYSGCYAALTEEHGYPLYVYDEDVIAEQFATLRKTFAGFTILYSVKTNPHPAILRFMAANRAGADTASSFEVVKALTASIPPEKIYYSAPGKPTAQLADALGRCVITADSYSELARLDVLAAGKMPSGQKLPVGLRINPNFAFGPGEFAETLPGASNKFGVDEESLAEHKEFFASLKHLEMTGIHVFLRSQVLNHASLATSFEAIFKLALFCSESLGWKMNFINFGGGLGIAPAVQEKGLDTASLQSAVAALVARYSPLLPECDLLLESGRFLVGRAGTFVTKIEDVKESRGTTYVIAPGGMSGFLRPSVMNLLNSFPFEVKGPFEPLFSSPAAHRVSLPEKTGGIPRRVTVSGNLCTSLDVIAKDVTLPDPCIGDILAVSNAGAYAATLSPFAFASFPKPAEVYRRRDGERVVVEVS